MLDELSARLGQKINRHDFLRIAAAYCGAAMATSAVGAAEKIEKIKAPAKKKKPTFADRYRAKLDYDTATISTHNINCWFQQNCAFHVFTKDGKVIREEQVADYPQENPDVPDFNPRGCQKGCTYSNMMYNEARVTKPLKRVGKRGEGKWKPISWNEALDDIANQIIKTIKEDYTQAIVVDPGGTGMVSYTTFYSMFRFFEFLDSVILDINTELGDDQQGAAVTYGEIAGDRSGGDYFYSDLIIIWGGNPAYTQIPNFHFITEARYNGTEVISIAPDLNASAIHADIFVPVKPGTDSALANAMAHVMIEEKLFDAQMVKEQTDLPFLVRTDNQKLLRASEVDGGSKEQTYRYNLRKKKLDAADQASLALGKIDPALEGTFSIRTKQGYVKVTPVFAILKKQLKKYTPEYAAKICGVNPETIRMLARKLCKASAATNVCTSAISKFYHGDIMQRSMILVFMLAGQLGRKGSGFVSTSFLIADGSNKLIYESEVARENRLQYALDKGPSFWQHLFKKKSYHLAAYKYGVDVFNASQVMTNSTLYWVAHAGMSETSWHTDKYDPHLKKPLNVYLQSTIEDTFHVDVDKKPKIFFACGGNLLRRLRGSANLTENLWPDLDLVVTLDMRMSSTAMYSDYVLPVSGAYEKGTSMVANSNSVVPFLHSTQKVVENVGESKNEWQIVCMLAEKIQKKAEEMSDATFKTRHDKTRFLDRIHDFLTFDFGAEDHDKINDEFIDDSTNIAGDSDDIKKKGYVAFTGLGYAPANWGNATDIKKGQTITPYTWHTQKKKPWYTLTGRVQFYIDHDWYIELGETLPIHKDPIKSGGDYPLILTGGHARWSIHAQWRTDPKLLRLQRGEPCLFISHQDAKKRKLKDDDKVKVFNDVGHFITRVKISAKPMPGQVIMYHAWENYQFENWRGYRDVLASPLNPIELAADEIYLRPVLAQKQPGQSDRDTRVEIKKVK